MAIKPTADAPFEPPRTLPNLSVGTSGWAYPTWKPAFYPPTLSTKKFLPFYASRLNSVEVNYTFRATPSARMLNEWIAATPPGFRFSFKAPQRITHFSRLRECGPAVQAFLEVLDPVRKARKLGIILFQLPPNFKADLQRLDAFLAEPALRGRGRPPVAFEFRHESWFTKAVYASLRRADAALCVAESDDLATPEVHPAKRIACFRLRRNGGYTEAETHAFAARFAALAVNRHVYAYLKHEDAPTGAWSALALTAAAAAIPSKGTV